MKATEALLAMLRRETPYDEPGIDPDERRELEQWWSPPEDGSYIHDYSQIDRFPVAEVPSALEVLRDGLALDADGHDARRLYAVVRLAGPLAPEVGTVVSNPDHPNLLLVLHALNRGDRGLEGAQRFDVLGLQMGQWLARLVDSGTRDVRRASLSLICRVSAPEAVHWLYPYLFDVDYSDIIQRAVLSGCAAVAAATEAPADAREVYERYAVKLRGAGPLSPFTEIARRAAVIASISGRDEHLARATVGFIDRLPVAGVLPRGANEMGVSTWHERRATEIAPFTRLLLAAVDALSDEDHDQLASMLEKQEPLRFEVAAAGWVRLPPERRRALAEALFAHRDVEPALEEARIIAMVNAWTSREGPDDPELEAFFSELASEGPSRVRVVAARAASAPSTDELEERIRRAFDAAELEDVLEVAARAEAPVGRAALRRLRERKFPLDGRILELLEAVLTDDDEDWVEQEIDGDNPYSDRRRTLSELLRRRRS